MSFIRVQELHRWLSGKEPACQSRREKRNGSIPGWEDPLEEGMAPVFLPGEFPWTEEPGGPQPMGLQRIGHD